MFKDWSSSFIWKNVGMLNTKLEGDFRKSLQNIYPINAKKT